MACCSVFGDLSHIFLSSSSERLLAASTLPTNIVPPVLGCLLRARAICQPPPCTREREREMKFVVDASPLFHIPLISRRKRLPALSFATPVDSLSLPVAPTESHTHEGSCRDGSVLVGRERMHRTRFFGCRRQKNASAGKVEWFGTRWWFGFVLWNASGGRGQRVEELRDTAATIGRQSIPKTRRWIRRNGVGKKTDR